MQRICVVDTNVVVSGLIVADSSSPPARILNAMIDGSLMYLMSPELLDEYAAVLGRPALVRIHGRTRDELDRLLTELVANSIWREPTATTGAPDPGDNHLWALLASEPNGHNSLRVTGLSWRIPRAASRWFPRVVWSIPSCGEDMIDAFICHCTHKCAWNGHRITINKACYELSHSRDTGRSCAPLSVPPISSLVLNTGLNFPPLAEPYSPAWTPQLRKTHRQGQDHPHQAHRRGPRARPPAPSSHGTTGSRVSA